MNNIYELLPFKGLSDLLFGTSRSEIRQKIDAEFSENGEIDFELLRNWVENQGSDRPERSADGRGSYSRPEISHRPFFDLRAWPPQPRRGLQRGSDFPHPTLFFIQKSNLEIEAD